MKRKLFGKRLKIQLGAGIVILIVLMAIFAPLLAPYDPYAQNLMARLVPPVWSEIGSWAHPLGTDNFGCSIDFSTNHIFLRNFPPVSIDLSLKVLKRMENLDEYQNRRFMVYLFHVYRLYIST